MKVKVFGIQFNTGKAVTVSQFFDHLIASNTTNIDFHGFKRFLYLKKHEDKYVGLFITTKDHKKFMEMSGDGGNVEITARDVTKGSALADFNFFVVHSATGRGLYQHYYHSCTFTQFGTFSKSYFEQLKGQMLDAALKGVDKKTEQTKLRQKFKEALVWTYFMRQESFTQLIAKLSRIKSFAFGISSLVAKESVFTPLGGLSKSVKQTYTFEPETKLNQAVEAIKSALGLIDIDDASVQGINDKDEPVVIHLESNLDAFAEYDFDDVANKMSKFTPANFEKSWMTLELLKLIKNNGPRFTLVVDKV